MAPRNFQWGKKYEIWHNCLKIAREIKHETQNHCFLLQHQELTIKSSWLYDCKRLKKDVIKSHPHLHFPRCVCCNDSDSPGCCLMGDKGNRRSASNTGCGHQCQSKCGHTSKSKSKYGKRHSICNLQRYTWLHTWQYPFIVSYLHLRWTIPLSSHIWFWRGHLWMIHFIERTHTMF